MVQESYLVELDLQNYVSTEPSNTTVCDCCQS